MKSDREFLDGIYEKAEQRAKDAGTSYKARRMKAFPVIAAAATALIVSGITGGLAKMKVNEDTRGQEITRSNSRERIMPEEYHVEGKVIKVLEPYMGYRRICIQVDHNKSTASLSKILDLLYLDETSVYQVGDSLRATLKKETIGTQEYYVIV